MANGNMTPINPQLEQQDIFSQIQERMSKAKKTEAEAEAIRSKIESQKIQDKEIETKRLGQELQNKEQKLNLIRQEEEPAMTPVPQEEPGPSQEQNIFDVASEGYGRGQLGPEPTTQSMMPGQERAEDALVQDTITPTGPATEITAEQDEVDPQAEMIAKQAPDLTKDPTGDKTSAFIQGTGSTVLGEAQKESNLFGETISNLQNQLNSIGQTSEELNGLRQEASKHQQTIREMSQIRDDIVNQFKRQTEELDTERERLRQPSYRKAIQDIPVIAKIGAVIHAGIQGYLGNKDPLSLVNTLIDRNYQDQVAEFNLQSELLDKKENMIGRFYNISKDQQTAKFEYQKYMYDSAKDVYLQALQDERYTQQQKTAIQGQLNNVLMKKEEIDIAERRHRETLMSKQMETRYDRWHKDRMFGLKKEEVEIKRKGKGPNLASMRNVAGIPNVPFYDKKEAKEYTKALTPKKIALKSLGQVPKLAKELGEGKTIKSAWNTLLAFAGEKLPPLTRLSPAVRKAYVKREQLTRLLTQTALQARIQFTGGGNMNDNERRILLGYHNLAEKYNGGDIGDLELQDQLFSMIRGDYSILAEILQWESAHSAYSEFTSRSPIGDRIPFEQFAEKELKFTGKALQDVIRRHKGGGKFSVQLNPILPRENII